MSSFSSKFFVLHIVAPSTSWADLLLAAPDAVVDLRLHRVEGLLQLLLRDGPHVLLERPVAQIDEAVAEDQLPVVAAAGVGLDGEVRQAGGGVEGDELVQGVELRPAARQHQQLRHAGLVVGIEEQLGISRGRGVADHHAHGAVRGPHRDLFQQRREDLHAATAAREGEEGQRGLGRDYTVHPQGVVHQDPVGAALDGEHRVRRSAPGAPEPAGRSRSPAWW